MADAVLSEEVRKRRAADALNGQDDGDPDPESDTSDVQSSDADTGTTADTGSDQGDGTEATDQEEVSSAAAGKAPRLSKVQTFDDYSVSAREPVGGTGANVPQNVPRGTDINAQARFLNPATGSYEERVYSPPPEQGDQPYVIDQDTGAKVPRAQLATAEDIAAQPPPSGTELPRVTVQAPGEPAPDQLTQVERAELVKSPAEAPGTLTQVERGELVKVPPGTAPRAVAVQTFDDYGAQAPAQPAAPGGKPAEPVMQQPAAQPPAAQPQGGDSGVANFFIKRGDKPITSANDPRLTTVTVGDQSWQVNKEAAPAFQGFLSELASKGAPVKALYPNAGWAYRTIADTNKLSEHAYGGAIDVNQTLTGRNQVTADFQKWMAANPGALEAAEKKWNIYGGERFGDLGHFEWGGVPLKPAPAEKSAPVPPVKVSGITPLSDEEAREPDIDIQSNGYSKGRGDQNVRNVVLHSTDGTEKGDVNTLTQSGKVGVHYYVTKDGRSFHFVNDSDSAWQAGKDKYGNNANPYTIGIEQEHIDGKEAWPDAQVHTTAKIAAGILKRNPNLTLEDVVGHSDIAGERKQDPVDYPWDHFRAYVAAYMGQGAAPGKAAVVSEAAPSARKAAGIQTFDDYGAPPPAQAQAPAQGVAELNVTHYGYRDDPNLDADSAAGRGKYIEHMIPGYDVGLNDKARALVGNPKPGEVFSYNGRQWRYGDQVPEGYSDARFDVYDPDKTFRATGKYRWNIAAQPQQPPAPAMRTLSPEEQTATQAKVQAAIQKQDSILGQLPEQTTSPVALYKRLSSVVGGVSDARRLAYRDQVKVEITKSAQDYYGEQDPNKAFARATADANFGTVAGDVIKKVGPYFNQAVTAFNQSAAVIDQNRLDDLAKAVHPQASADARKTFINSIISEPDPAVRAAHINAIIGRLAQENPNNPALAALRATDIADSAERLANPEYQKRQQEEIERQVALNMRDLRPDPQLRGTTAGWWAEQLAQLPKNIVEGITGPVGDSLMVSEIYQGTLARLRQENPGMSEEELKAKIGGSSATQVIAMMTLNRLSGGKLGTMVGQIENPALRIGASALSHTAVGGTIGAAQQVATNIAEGKPALEGVGQGAAAGAVQALPGAVLSGLHGRAAHVEERLPVTEERAQVPLVTEERPPVTEEPPLAQERPPVEFTQAAPPFTQPVTQEAVARRAYEIFQDREQAGQPGNALSDWTQAQQELANGATPPVTQGESEPWVSAIANRFTAERIANGEIGPVAPGQGMTKEEMMTRGLKMGSEEINQHVSDLMNNVGNPRDQAAAIRTEEARLSQVSHNTSLASEANPADQQLRIAADNAFKDLTDFHNGPVAKLKNNWHAAGMGLQGELPVDLSTFNGLREDFLKNVGKPPPPEMEPVMRAAAQKVRDASTAEVQAMKNLGAEIDRQSARRPLPSEDQVRENIMRRMKVDPCRT